MDLSEISRMRLQNQQIEVSTFDSAKELVKWLGAMQAQDFAMAKWAIGLRIINATKQLIETAYNQGDIIRTHLLRPTWHIVAAEDVYWILELTAPRIKPLLKSRDKHLELTEEIYSRSNRLLENILSNCMNLTREELSVEYTKINIKTDENRLSHILLRAELDGIVCSGPLKGNKLTYCLLENRVPDKKLLNSDESLAELANRYFNGHGPATLPDFVWWSGLSITDARKGLEMNKSGLISETIESETYWFPNQHSIKCNDSSLHLLPAFDELLISYRNRSATISDSLNKKAISNNGIFRPLVVVDGQVTGIWKQTTIKNKIQIEIDLFQQCDETIKMDIENKVKQYAFFLDREIELRIK